MSEKAAEEGYEEGGMETEKDTGDKTVTIGAGIETEAEETTEKAKTELTN